MRMRIAILLLITITCGSAVSAQSWRDEYDKFKEKQNSGKDYRKDYDNFKNKAYREYKQFRDSAFNQYLEFVKKEWKEFKGEPARVLPKEEEVVPVFSNDADKETASWFSNLFKRKGKSAKKGKIKTVQGKGEEIKLKEVLTAEQKHEQIHPEKEIYQCPEEKHEPNKFYDFRLFGTEYRVRIGDNCRPVIQQLTPESVAKSMEIFKQKQFDDLLYDCQQERKKHNLSDWAYYQMLQSLVDHYYGKGTNEASLVLAFIYAQSGYKIRMAYDNNQHLYMLVACRHYIFGKDYTYDGAETFYLLDGRKLGNTIHLCPAYFAKESSMSLQMSAVQEFSRNPTPRRTITSLKNRDFSFTIVSNKNYMEFYNVYPRSTIGNNFMTQWVMYAETPMEQGIREQLYPPMREKLKGLSQGEAVQQLLWWVQTGLVYEFDEELWGTDRPFFGEESLFYPYCDCEDRAILFSHLVRDLLHLDVALVYYPGHLAAAVAFTENVDGNYYKCDGRNFTVCDPTIVPGRVGEVMELVANEPATLMLLRRD